MKQPKIIDYLLLTFLALIWSSAFFNIKIATYSYGPMTIALGRVFFGAMPVVLLCLYKKIKIEAFSKDWHWFAMIGFINLVAPFFLISYGVKSGIFKDDDIEKGIKAITDWISLSMNQEQDLIN